MEEEQRVKCADADAAIRVWLRRLGLSLRAKRCSAAEAPGEDEGSRPVCDLLRNGVVLCHVANRLKPGAVSGIHDSESIRAPSRRNFCLENIERFLGACRVVFGLGGDELCAADDVYDAADAVRVAQLLAILAARARELDRTVPPFEENAQCARVKKPSPRGRSQSTVTPVEYRQMIVDEIHDTERGYLKDLIFLIQAYVRPIKEARCLTSADFRHLFSNVVPIFEFQKSFWKRMEAVIRQPPREQRLGRLFLDACEEFKVYTTYCANHPSAVGVLMHSERSPAWRQFRTEWERQYKQTFDIASYLIRPIQRICRYPLLLRELIKKTPDDHDDLPALRQALQAMNGVTSYINEMKRKMENLQSSIDLQGRISEWTGPDLLLCGPILRDDIVPVAQLSAATERGAVGPMYVILMEQRLIWCTISTKSKCRGHYIFQGAHATSCVVYGDQADGAIRLRLEPGDDCPHPPLYGLVLEVDDDHDKAEWLAALRRVCRRDEDGDAAFGRLSVVQALQRRNTRVRKRVTAQDFVVPDLAVRRGRGPSASQVDSTRLFLEEEFEKESAALAEIDDELLLNPEAPPALVQAARSQRDVVKELRTRLSQLPESKRERKERERRFRTLCKEEAKLGRRLSKQWLAQDKEPRRDCTRASVGTIGAGHAGRGADKVSFQEACSALCSLDEALETVDLASVAALSRGASFAEGEPDPMSRTTAELAAAAKAMDALAAEFCQIRQTCAGCQQPLADGDDVLLASGKAWHRLHFRCHHCDTPLLDGLHYRRDGRPYCEADYLALFNTCRACGEGITDLEYITMNGDDDGPRWHREHFCCAECLGDLLGVRVYDCNGRLLCERHYRSTMNGGCGGCGEVIESGAFLQALGRTWHPRCFRCAQGGCPVVFHDGLFCELDGLAYCERHYSERSGALCLACDSPITGHFVAVGNGKFHKDCYKCAQCQRLLTLAERVHAVQTPVNNGLDPPAVAPAQHGLPPSPPMSPESAIKRLTYQCTACASRSAPDAPPPPSSSVLEA